MSAAPVIPEYRRKTLPSQPVAKRSVGSNVEHDAPSLEPRIKKVHIPGKAGKPVGVDQHANHHQESSGNNFKDADVLFKTIEHS